MPPPARFSAKGVTTRGRDRDLGVQPRSCASVSPHVSQAKYDAQVWAAVDYQDVESLAPPRCIHSSLSPDLAGS
jgi:hypothetical protein